MNPPLQKKLRAAALVPAALLFVLVLCAFLPAVRNDFVGYDDPEYVTGNPRIQEGLNAHTVSWAFGATAASNWHPITWLSHMLDYQFFGLNASGHHFTSVLLHALNATLLLVVLRRFTGAAGRSFIVAAFFGLHPLRVESVAWISERKDVLSGLFFLLTIWAYGRYAESVKCQVAGGKSEIRNSKAETNPKSGAQNPSLAFTSHALRFYALSLILFALGLMSKPMLVTVPFVLLLLDYWPLRRWPEMRALKERGQPCPRESPSEGKTRGQGCPRSLLLLEKLPFALLALAASIITYIVQKQAGAVVTGTPFLIRFENAVLSYGRYLAKLVWPVNLAPFYPFPSQFSAATVLITGILLGLVTVAALKFRQKIRAVPAGWLWYLGMLVPVIGLVQAGEQAMADRYSYLPSIGAVIAIIWTIHELVKSHPVLKPIAIGSALAGIVACTAVTHKQIAIWKNSETLFSHMIRVTENNYLAHNDLGATFEKQGRFEEAKTELQEAIREKPDYAEAYDNLGVVLQKQGHLDQAMVSYSNALTFVPAFAPAHNHLGLALATQSQLEGAVQQYKEALRHRPDYADAHFNLGLALAHLGKIDESIGEYRRSLEIQPGSADAHNNLGTVLDRKGDLPSAIQEYQSAVRLKPDYARAHLNLGMALARTGRLQDAIIEVQGALRLKPDFPEARQSLGVLQEMQKTK